MENKILVLDSETTGFSPTKSKIVEIGIVSLDLITGNIETVFDQFIKEDGITWEEIQLSWIYQNSNILVDEIMIAKSLAHYFDEIQQLFNQYESGITAFNKSFDFNFMKSRGFIIPVELKCPMKLSKDICRIYSKAGGYKTPNVGEAYNYFFPDSNYIESHRAASDAKHEAEIVFELWKLGVF